METVPKELEKKLAECGAQIIEGKLPIFEVIYYAEKGLIQEDWKKLLAQQAKKDKLAKEKYHVIKHLREKGYITRLSLENSDFFRLYRKGFRPGMDKTAYLLKVAGKNWKTNVEELLDDLDFAGKLRKELIYAIAGDLKKKPIFVKIGRSSFE